MSTNPILEEINDVYTGLLALSKLFVQSNPKDTQQTHHEEWRRGICTQNGYNTGTKGRKKIVSPHVLFPKTDFPGNLIIPMRQICTGGYTPPQIN